MPVLPRPTVFTDAHGRKTNIAYPDPDAIAKAINASPIAAPAARFPEKSVRDIFTAHARTLLNAVTRAYLKPDYPGHECIAMKSFLDIPAKALHRPEPRRKHAGRPPPPSNEAERLLQTHKKVTGAMLLNKIARAMEALRQPSTPKTLTSADISAVHKLHPLPRGECAVFEASMKPTLAELAQVPVVTRKQVQKFVSTFNRNSAAGPSGFTHEAIAAIATSPGGCVAITNFVNAFTHSTCPPDPFPMSSALALAPKIKNGVEVGKRPTATKDPLISLAGKTVLEAVTLRIKQSSAPGQYCHKEHGCLLAVLDTVLRLGSDPLSVATFLDRSNAFNQNSRKQMLLAVRDIIPSLYPVYHRWYGTVSKVFFRGQFVCWSVCGVGQGCVLALAGYATLDHCLRRAGLFARLPGNKPIPGDIRFADDQTVISLPENVKYDVGIVKASLATIDSELNDSKESSFVPSHIDTATSSASMFGVVIGNPIGVRRQVESHLSSFFRDMDLVRQYASYSPVCAYYLVTTSIWPSVMSFLRSNPVSAHDLDNLNNRMLDELRWYTQVPDLQWKVVMLPPTNGGLGVHPAINSAHSLRLSLLDRLPVPPPGMPSNHERLLRAYQRFDPCVDALPTDEVSPNEPLGTPPELDDRGQPIPLPRCFFGQFASFVNSSNTIMAHDLFLAAMQVHLGVSPPPVLHGPHTANAANLCVSFFANFGLHSPVVPDNFHPSSFVSIAKNYPSFIQRPFGHLVASCVAMISIHARLNPEFVRPVPAAPPPPGRVAPRRELSVASDPNPYNPRRLVRPLPVAPVVVGALPPVAPAAAAPPPVRDPAAPPAHPADAAAAASLPAAPLAVGPNAAPPAIPAVVAAARAPSPHDVAAPQLQPGSSSRPRVADLGLGREEPNPKRPCPSVVVPPALPESPTQVAARLRGQSHGRPRAADLGADVFDADHLAKRLKSLAAPSQVPQNEEEQEIHQPHSSSSARSAAAPAPAPARDPDPESDDDRTRPNSPDPLDDDLTRPNSPETQGTPP